MNVNGISGAGMQTGAAGRGIGGGQMDAESKNLQQQIDRLQQQLKKYPPIRICRRIPK